MKKSFLRTIGLIMLIIATIFIIFALTHPEANFPWNNAITWILYALYTITTILLLIAPIKKKP